MSDWHIDQHGLTTSALCEFGRKLWVSCPGMPREMLREYAAVMYQRDGAYENPKWPCIGIPLVAGNVLVQPAGTLHAPTPLTRWP